jgi:hypothetical protein
VGGFLFYRHVKRRKRALQQGIESQISSKAGLASMSPPKSEVASNTVDRPRPAPGQVASDATGLAFHPAPPLAAHQSLYPNPHGKGVPVPIEETMYDPNISSSSFAHFQSVQSSTSTTSAPHLPSLHFTPPDGDIGSHISGIDGRPQPQTQNIPICRPSESTANLVSDPTSPSGMPPTVPDVAACESVPSKNQRVPYDQWRFGL